jgi:hypothetical protein
MQGGSIILLVDLDKCPSTSAEGCPSRNPEIQKIFKNLWKYKTDLKHHGQRGTKSAGRSGQVDLDKCPAFTVVMSVQESRNPENILEFGSSKIVSIGVLPPEFANLSQDLDKCPAFTVMSVQKSRKYFRI